MSADHIVNYHLDSFSVIGVTRQSCLEVFKSAKYYTKSNTKLLKDTLIMSDINAFARGFFIA